MEEKQILNTEDGGTEAYYSLKNIEFCSDGRVFINGEFETIFGIDGYHNMIVLYHSQLSMDEDSTTDYLYSASNEDSIQLINFGYEKNGDDLDNIKIVSSFKKVQSSSLCK